MPQSPFIGNPIVSGCQSLLAPATPAQGGIGPSYIEQTIDQTYFALGAPTSDLLLDFSSQISGSQGFFPQCIEIVNPSAVPFNIVYQSAGFVQRMRVPPGFTSRRKIVFVATPFQVYMSWGVEGLRNNNPFLSNQNSNLRVRIYNFPLNDEASSMWHFWGPFSTQIGGGAGIGQHILWNPGDTSVYKIRRLDVTVFNSTSAGSINLGFYSTTYTNSPASSLGAGMISIASQIPASWAQEFNLFDNMGDDTEGIIIGGFGSFFAAYLAAVVPANMVIFVNMMLDAFDPLLGRSVGLLS